MMAKPRHSEGQAIFITAFWNKVEIVVGVDRALTSAGIGGIRVEDVAIIVLVEDADARSFRAGKFRDREVVFHFAFANLLGREGGLVIEVEVRVVGRDPTELPAHSLFEAFDLGYRRAGICRTGHVT